MRKDISGWSTRVTDADIAKNEASGVWPRETVHECAWRKADATPDAVATFLEDGNHITYGAIAEEARHLAAAMLNLGLRPGDTVSFQLPNWREATAVDLACSALGVVINPIIPIYRGAECEYILNDARTRMVFIPETLRNYNYADMIAEMRDRLPLLDHVVVVRPETEGHSLTYTDLITQGKSLPQSFPQVEPNNIKLIMYTSGTTGRPKGVLHTHNTLRASGILGTNYWNFGPGDVMIMPSPVTHITGYSLGIEFPFTNNCQSALMARWDANKAVDYIQQVSGTMTVGATPFLHELVAAMERKGTGLPTMRMFACGGAAVPPDLVHKAHQVFDKCRVFRMYGSSECPAITRGWMGPDEEKLAAETDGKIIGWEVKIVDDDGNPVPEGSEGEILARGASMMAGYADPEQNADAFDKDGYFLTGDLGIRTPEGAILVTGRKKDLIIRGGENLSAKEIEDALHKFDEKIEEASVVSMPHPRLGEGVCAYIIPKPGVRPPDVGELAAFLDRRGLAKQKFPERVEIVEDFPRTASGKIQKHILRAMIKETVAAEAS